MKTILALFCLSLALVLPATAAPFQVKADIVDRGVLDTGRPSKINIWYPEGTCLDNTARRCLANATVTSKVVLLSHGSMGSADNYSWLGESLAAAGFVVVGINHYGESRIYGEDTQPTQQCAHLATCAGYFGALDPADGRKSFPARCQLEQRRCRGPFRRRPDCGPAGRRQI